MIASGRSICVLLGRRQMGSLAVKGSPSTLTYTATKYAASAPAAGEVRVSLKASPVTNEDIRAIRGVSFVNKITENAGTAGVGVVDAVGAGVTGVVAGDSVLVTSTGTWSDSVTVSVADAFKIPTLSAEEAATIPALASAWAILNNYVKLASGETVLQLNGASTPIGKAVSEVGKALGLNVVNIAQSEIKTFDGSKHGPIKLAITTAVGYGTDLSKLIAKSGTILFYNGKIIPIMAGDAVSLSVTAAIFENKSVVGFDFSAWARSDTASFRKGLEFATSSLSSKKVSLKPKVYKLADYGAALKAVEETGEVAVFKE